MKAIIMIKLCVAFLLTIVPDGVRVESITEVLIAMANNGTIVDGIFEPLVDGSLGHNQHGVIHIGYFIPLEKEVAMKFTPMMHEEISDNEYRAYNYLRSVNCPIGEEHGIPSIYYYGEWNDYKMMAMALPNSTSQPIIDNIANIEEWELLVAFREFVKVIKYIHSRGIIHRDTNIKFMEIQNGQGFIFNFGCCIDMNFRMLEENIADAKKDFLYFLYTLFELVSTWQWFGFTVEDGFIVRDIHCFRYMLATVARRNQGSNLTGLRRVFHEFGKHALDNLSAGSEDANGNWVPFYDQLYGVINEEMINYGMATSPDPSLANIPDPFAVNDWPRPALQMGYFEYHYRAWRNIGG